MVACWAVLSHARTHAVPSVLALCPALCFVSPSLQAEERKPIFLQLLLKLRQTSLETRTGILGRHFQKPQINPVSQF
jgi:hypothetical protein